MPCARSTQALIQQWWGEIGVATELKNIDAGVFFGPTDNADSLSRFYTDVQMFTNGNDSPNPQAYLGGWRCVNENGVNIPNNAKCLGRREHRTLVQRGIRRAVERTGFHC
jgi:ABC-type transport system substrate-binding protein